MCNDFIIRCLADNSLYDLPCDVFADLRLLKELYIYFPILVESTCLLLAYLGTLITIKLNAFVLICYRRAKTWKKCIRVSGYVSDWNDVASPVVI